MQDILGFELTILNALLLLIVYFLIGLIVPTAINTLVWKKAGESISVWLNITTLIVVNSIFFFSLSQRVQYKLDFLKNITTENVLLAFACSILFFLLLDKFLDTIFDKLFPASAIKYQETLVVLRQFPVTTFIRVCLFAPVTEEILMRGFLLNGLQNKYGTAAAIAITSLLFAVLHFNFVQTLSAVICGLVLGLLYFRTGSLSCCIIAHALYNSISFYTMVVRRA